jgi:hypothetical protein
MALSATITNCQNDGSNFALYWNGGTAGTPIWLFHDGIIGDVNLGMVDDENESNRRTSTNIKEYNPGKTDISITGQQIPDGNYIGNAAFNSAIKDGNPVDLLALTDDVDIQYAYGVRGEFYNFDRSISAPSSGDQEQSFNFKPAACPTTAVRYVRVDPAGTVGDWDPTSVDISSP